MITQFLREPTDLHATFLEDRVLRAVDAEDSRRGGAPATRAARSAGLQDRRSRRRLGRFGHLPVVRRTRPSCCRNLMIARIAAMSFFALSGLSGTALADDEYFPTEPPLADSGWTVRYNELLLACSGNHGRL
jgi:hypothetical protein